MNHPKDFSPSIRITDSHARSGTTSMLVFNKKTYQCKAGKNNFLFLKQTKYTNCCIEYYCQLKYVVMSRALYD